MSFLGPGETEDELLDCAGCGRGFTVLVDDRCLLCKAKVLPFVWQDEDGDAYWGLGHIDPALFVLATAADMASLCGPDEMVTHLLGWTPTDRLPRAGRHLVAPDRRYDHATAIPRVQGLVDGVDHLWFLEDPDNEEIWTPGAKDEPGARAVTKLVLR